MKDTAIVWFRNDLRVNHNTSLSKAAANHSRVIGVYCFDPRHFDLDHWGFKKTEKFRAQFLLESVQDLKESLANLNISLLVHCAKPEDILPKIAQDYNAATLYCQKEWTREEVQVNQATQANTTMNWIASYDQFLFHPDDIPFATFQDIPKVFTQFRKICEKQASVRQEVASISPLEPDNLVEEASKVPTLEDLGFPTFTKDTRSAFPFTGGSASAHSRLQNYFWETKKLAFYKKTRNGLLGTDYSSKFSPWLANGSISARQIYWDVKRFEREIKKNQDTYWLIFELIWRDYFKYVSLKHGDAIFYQEGILNKEYGWHQNKAALNDWINGNTPYDFVNANMIELCETGWMSNRGRQNVASYWAKELKQDWRIGAAYFESMLLDYDVHSNYGNWMYNAGVGNDPRDRKFNIERQAQMYDKDGRFVKKWLQTQLF